MIYVYILRSLIDNGYYIGISKDLNKRLIKHNKGGVYSTERRKPLELIYSEKFNNYFEARAREKEIKSYKGGNSFKKLIKYCGIV